MFTIINQVSGKTFQTDDNSSILDSALANGLNFPYGCQKGACGKCIATIIEGEVGYSGDILSGISPQELADGMALLCQCMAKSDVELVVTELDSVAGIEQMVEKPTKEQAPSNLAIIGRYILTPEIFKVLENTTADKNGEIQITDALLTLAKQNQVIAYQFQGKRFDCGSVEGFVEATNYFYSAPQ